MDSDTLYGAFYDNPEWKIAEQRAWLKSIKIGGLAPGTYTDAEYQESISAASFSFRVRFAIIILNPYLGVPVLADSSLQCKAVAH